MRSLRLGLGSCLVVALAACAASKQPASATSPPDDAEAVDAGSGGSSVAHFGDDAAAVIGTPTSPGAPAAAEDSGADASSAAPTSACPATSTWKPGAAQQTIALDFGSAGTRSYDVYVGSGVKPGTAVPLLVNMHGLTNTPAIQAAFSQMNPVADTNGFIVVYPDGVGQSFNAGTCCAPASTEAIDDVDFVRAVVKDAESKICVDPKRVYETGFSNGGMMAYQLACNAADLFAAVAPTEGENVTSTPCDPSRPVPIGAFQYLADPIVLAASAQQSVTDWATTQLKCANAAAPTQTTESGFACSEWSGCTGGALAWYCTMPGGTHLPPAGSAPVVWSFLSKFALP